MAAIAWEDVVGVAPELAGKLVGLGQASILSVVNSILDVCNWGGEDDPKLAMARALYAAHLATLMLRRGNPGIVSSSAVGGMSRGYTLPPLGSFSTLQLTSYGLLFKQLAATTPARAGFSTAMAGPNPGSFNGGGGGFGGFGGF